MGTPQETTPQTTISKSPERLMLEALQFAQALRTTTLSDKDQIKAWRQFDALAAEAIAALARKNQPPTEAQKEEYRKIGNGLGFILGMRPDHEEPDRWWTKWGTKTGLGLVLTIERFVLHFQGHVEAADSMSNEARALAAEGQKVLDAAKRRKSQRDRSNMTQAEFYKTKDVEP